MFRKCSGEKGLCSGFVPGVETQGGIQLKIESRARRDMQ
jgi:hypothetical protein